jgi:uncharacterized membrane protein (DUF106 family)
MTKSTKEKKMTASSKKKQQQQQKQLKKSFISSWPKSVKIILIIVGIYILFVIIGTIGYAADNGFNSWLDTLGKDVGKLVKGGLWAFLFYSIAVWAIPALGAGASTMWKKYQLYNQEKTTKEAAEELGCTEKDWKDAAEEFKKENGREPTKSELQVKMMEKMQKKMNENYEKKIEAKKKEGDKNVEQLENEQKDLNEAGEKDIENAKENEESEGGGEGGGGGEG